MRLLIAGEVNSAHTARWVNQLKDTGWQVHVFQVNANGTGINPDFEYGILHYPSPWNAQADVEVRMPVYYKGELVGDYSADILVDGRIILELKALSDLTSQHPQPPTTG